MNLSTSSTQHHTAHQWLGNELDFNEIWEFQLDYAAKVLSGEKSDCFFYLEHSPIYTIGRTRDQSSLQDLNTLPHPVVEINRGGQGTYHGPGQLVGYPILNLRKYGKDLHLYVRSLEQALINTCADFGLAATRRDSLTGVWIEDRKLASIGVGVKKWISMHGFAINITAESLPPFFAITPCGIDNVSMTCVSDEIKQELSVQEFMNILKGHLENSTNCLT